MNNNKAKEINIIGNASDVEDVQTLKAGIERLKAENARLDAELKSAKSERDTYERWWSDSNADNKKLKEIVKSLISYAGLS